MTDSDKADIMAGMLADIDKSDEKELYRLWETYGARMAWTHALERGANADIVAGVIAELPDVTAVDALEANRRLIDLLTGQRWFVMRDAREAGATWDEIGTALGMSRQGAYDWYRRAIAAHADHVGDLHHAERAQAAL